MTPKAYRSCFRSARHRGADQRSGSRPACRIERRGQGHVRHRRRAHRLRQSGMARDSRARHAQLPAGAENPRRRRNHHRQDGLRRIFLQRQRRQRALRHAGECARAGPPAGRLVGWFGRCLRRRSYAILRSAAIPAARYAFQPPSTESTACGRRTSVSSTCRRRRHGADFRRAGLVRRDARRIPQSRCGAARRPSRAPQKSNAWSCWKTPSRRRKNRLLTCCARCSNS